jgi:flagellin-like protein
MNNANARMKCSKKAVTPVIATIILIAGTLVLALVVGAYTFGLFGSNVKTVTLASATLYGGLTASQSAAATASLSLSLNNPGSATTITSITLTGTGLSTPVTLWSLQAGAITGSGSATTISFAAAYTSPGGPGNAMYPGQVTSFTFYPVSGSSSSGVGTIQQSITTGQTFNYVINFANGQSVSGSLIAQ